VPESDQLELHHAGHTHRSEKAQNGGRDKFDREDAKIVEAADPASSGNAGLDVIAADDARRIKPAVEVAPREQGRRRKEAVASANVSRVFQVVHTSASSTL